jgi:hypothetical protein
MTFFQKDVRSTREAAIEQLLGRLNLERVDTPSSRLAIPLALAAAAAAGWLLGVFVKPAPARKLRRRPQSRLPTHRPASRRAAAGKAAAISKVAH